MFEYQKRPPISRRSFKLACKRLLPVTEPVTDVEVDTAVRNLGTFAKAKILLIVKICETMGVVEVDFKTEAEGCTEATGNAQIKEAWFAHGFDTVVFTLATRVPRFHNVEVEFKTEFCKEIVGDVITSRYGNQNVQSCNGLVIAAGHAHVEATAVALVFGFRAHTESNTDCRMDVEGRYNPDHGIVRNAEVDSIATQFVETRCIAASGDFRGP